MKAIGILLLVFIGVWFLLKGNAEKSTGIQRAETPSTSVTGVVDATVPVPKAKTSEAQKIERSTNETRPEIKTNQFKTIAPILTKLPAVFNEKAISAATSGSTSPTTEDTDHYKKMFPTDGVGHEHEDTIGLIEGDVSDIGAFLDSHDAPLAADAPMNIEKRAKSGFFRELANRSFTGKIFFGGKDTPTVNVALSISDAVQGGMDQIKASDSKAKNFELRTVRKDDGGIWRLDLFKLGIFLPQDRCPWSADFNVERKQFFYLAKNQKLVANVYCGKGSQGKFSWQRVGILVADPTFE